MLGENYEQLEVRGLTGYIPAHGGYKGEHKGFTCRQGKHMLFDQVYAVAQGNAKKRYRAKASECQHCPLAEQCKGKKAREKRLHHTPYKAQCDRMLERLATRVGQRMRRLRASTVEPVLDSLSTYYGLRHLNKKRQAGAAKVMYVAATGYNLKRYLRCNAFQPGGWGIVLPAPAPFHWLLLYFCNSHVRYNQPLGIVVIFTPHYPYSLMVVLCRASNSSPLMA